MEYEDNCQFLNSRKIANYEAIRWNVLSSINFFFLKCEGHTYISYLFEIFVCSSKNSVYIWFMKGLNSGKFESLNLWINLVQANWNPGANRLSCLLLLYQNQGFSKILLQFSFTFWQFKRSSQFRLIKIVSAKWWRPGEWVIRSML